MGPAEIIYGLFFLLHIALSRCDVHSLSCNFLGSEGLGLPSYTESVTVNDVTLFYYDSAMKSSPPYPEWANTPDAQQHWKEIILLSLHNRAQMGSALQTAMSEFNLTGTFSKMNVYQGYSRCDLYPDGTTKASLAHAFNGKDFITLDIDNKRYIASVPEALKYKRVREGNIIMLESVLSFYKKTCFDRLRMFLEHAPQLSIKNAPQIRLLKRQRAGSTILTCHVTGFYPRAVQVKWIGMKNGKDLQLIDDEINDVLPNGDGTYQTRRSVIRPEEDTEDQLYTCVVHHSSLGEGNITITWEETSFGHPVYITLSCIFVLAVVGLVIWCLVKATGKQHKYSREPLQ
ncbi:major histocompatibility complex class I-related gene protein-like [Clarias gariepinus]|uniref:major histocompatibility complex class I-related gene protein-like n=1 Tax=Clarias gariepinus TaxID=13013 RepID=UPI00234DFE6A|nr:major histocompatibility complex class I-related gene protein-like [Clarias gariepinus]